MRSTNLHFTYLLAYSAVIWFILILCKATIYLCYMQNKQFYTQLDICQESALLTRLLGPRYTTSSMDTKFTEQNRTELYYHKQNTHGRLPE